MLEISKKVFIPDEEIEITAIRAQGAGGQTVNKVSTAVHLRFDINASSLPDFYKRRLLKLKDRRVTNEGIIIIKAQKFRAQKKNKEEAIARLQGLIKKAGTTRRKRKPTKPTIASIEKRLESKKKQSRIKSLRGKVEYD